MIVLRGSSEIWVVLQIDYSPFQIVLFVCVCVYIYYIYFICSGSHLGGEAHCLVGGLRRSHKYHLFEPSGYGFWFFGGGIWKKRIQSKSSLSFACDPFDKMFFFLITCLSFFCFCKYSLPLKPLPAWAHEMRLLSMSAFQIKKSIRSSLAAGAIEIGFSKMSMKMPNSSNFKAEEGREEETSMLLDLPELILDCIFERLPADGLCSMASVCSAMRERCTSDRLWRRHISHKWGRIMGPSAHRHWYWHLASAKDCSGGFQRRGRGSLIVSLSRLWPLSLITSNLDNAKRKKTTNLLPIGSVMSLYKALETGKFSFPAQVYNREV